MHAIFHRLFWVIIFLLTHHLALSQFKYYDRLAYKTKVDSLHRLNDFIITPKNDPLSLSVNLALIHYPELKGHDIKIVYRKNVRHPITAGYAFWNIFRLRRHHVYRLVLHPDSFVLRLSLNGQVSVIGHEMAHFTHYQKIPPVGMLIWGIKYSFSKKFRYRYEKEADRMAIDHGLGGQLLELSMYMSRSEVVAYLKEMAYLK